MHKLILTLSATFICCLATLAGQSGLRPVALTCEHMTDPATVEAVAPKLSWINEPADPALKGLTQRAYRIQVACSERDLRRGGKLVWDTGTVASDKSYLIPYAGKSLQSGRDYWWRVRVTDGTGKVSDWSEPAKWGMGLLRPEEWKARWIGAPWQGERALPEYADAPLFRKSFDISRKIASAKVFVTGLGYFELYLNGTKVGDDCLVPNFTNYSHRPEIATYGSVRIENNFRAERVLYLAYDVTNLLRKGGNAIGAILGNGFYNCFSHWVCPFGSPRLLCQLEITCTDGEKIRIVSNESWRCRRSPIIRNDVYKGEVYDAAREVPGWASPEGDEAGWEPAVLRTPPTGKLTAQTSPADKVTERLAPVSFRKNEKGEYEVDFGKEISGWIAFHGVQGQAGDTLDVRYICESPLGVQQYIFKDNDPVSWRPRFTWYVFSKAVIRGVDQLAASQLTAEAVNSDVPMTAEFRTSNELFNQINAIWQRSQLDNMHGGVASDCPHRERSAYTGDGQVASPTVMYNFGAAAFYRKWIRDMQDAQNPETGYVPNGAPWQPGCGGGVPWGAAMNIIPWEFYRHYGDLDALRGHYFAMKEQVRYMTRWLTPQGTMLSRRGGAGSDAPVYWLNLGEWCPPGKSVPDELVHTFYLWYCADLTAKAAEALGEQEERTEYAALADRVKTAFHEAFFQAGNHTYGDFGGNVFALAMGVPEERKAAVAEALRREIVEGHASHLHTGIFGTRFLFKVLAENGLNDLAVTIMNQRDYPSYGFWLEQGATTTWERWDGRDSHNHPMFGGGLVWFYEDLAGVQIDEKAPAFRHFFVRPQLSKELSEVHYANRTPYGWVSVTVRFDGTAGTLEVTVPVGSHATVHVPAASGGTRSVEEVPQGTYSFDIR